MTATTIHLDGNLYNIVHGTNRYAGLLLGMLGISPERVGRFRDCYLHRAEAGELEILLYTRNGGGNRAEHEDVTRALRAHPLYLRDFDDSFDRTYAAYCFRIPPSGSGGAECERIAQTDPDHALPKSHEERWKAFEHKMNTTPDDPEVLRVLGAMTPTIERITAAARDGGDQ